MSEPIRLKRVQTGVRIEQCMLKVFEALAEYLEMSLGDLPEGITMAAFAGRSSFVSSMRAKIEQLKAVYGMDDGAGTSYHMLDEEDDDA